MNLNFVDLLQPIVERFNVQVQKLVKFIEDRIEDDDVILVCVKGRYEAIERITISSKNSNQSTVEVYVFMDNTINVIYNKELQEVERTEGVDLWNPPQLQEEVSKIDSFFEKVEIS